MPWAAPMHDPRGAQRGRRLGSNGHQRTHKKKRTPYEMGYCKRWYAASKLYLRRFENRMCRPCERKGMHTRARQVDHIIPFRGDYLLKWDRSNWQPICDVCHGVKSARDGRIPRGLWVEAVKMHHRGLRVAWPPSGYEAA